MNDGALMVEMTGVQDEQTFVYSVAAVPDLRNDDSGLVHSLRLVQQQVYRERQTIEGTALASVVALEQEIFLSHY